MKTIMKTIINKIKNAFYFIRDKVLAKLNISFVLPIPFTSKEFVFGIGYFREVMFTFGSVTIWNYVPHAGFMLLLQVQVFRLIINMSIGKRR